MEQLVGIYNHWLVALSFGVAIATSYTAVDLVGRITANRGLSRHAWLAGGAIAMGSGIWCMHFIGMLAFHLPIPVYYNVPMVMLSLGAAILASLAALFVVSRNQMTHRSALLGSIVMGSGIGAMHYIGMAAMRLHAMHEYRPFMLLLSFIFAVIISYLGELLLFYLRDEDRGPSLKAMISVVLGLAIPVMHYTGMAAVSFRTMSGSMDLSDSVDISTLAYFAIFGVTGVILGFALITSIVDRRISKHNLIRENERKMLRALIDHIPDCMYVKDADGAFVLANLQMARTLGFEDPQVLIGKTDHNYYPEELANLFRADELRVMQSGLSLSEHEEDGMDLDGNTVPMVTTKVPIRDGKGQVIGIAGVGRDISERKKSEAALREAERKYRSMFDEALVGICRLGPNGHLLHVNPAMAESLGYSDPIEMVSSLTGPLWSLAASSKRQAEFKEAIEVAGYIRSFELEMLRKDRSSIWISSSVRTKYEEGIVVGYVGMFEDISERKILREQLLQAQKLESVGQLAAGIAHEINTPVQYIGDNVRFLRDTFEELVVLNREYGRLLAGLENGGVTSELLVEVAQRVKTIDVDYLFSEIPLAIAQTLEGVTRVAGLVSAMKEFSHPGTGEKIPLDLNHAIESTITVARNEWKYVAEMKTELDATLPFVSCLPGEFNQVVLNLIVNAAHAIADVAAAGGPTKGLITIRTLRRPGNVEIHIQDTGGGIPEVVRTRIFDPFFTTKEIGKGTGQGLAIARSVVVDKHQGAIDFETEEGRGTTFIIRLPCPEAVASAPDRLVA